MRLLKLTETPDRIHVSRTVLGFQYGDAFAFVTPYTLAVSGLSHPFIFNAAKRFASGDPRSVFKDYHVKFLGRTPTTKELQKFGEGLLGKTLSEMRQGTLAGRVWRDAEDSEVGRFNAISFWSDSNSIEANPTTVPTVISLFKLTGLTYIEAIDYKSPEIFATRKPELVSHTSKVAPDLDRKQIVDILVRAHSDPASLSRKEREVAWEFRGGAAKVILNHGYDSDAEYNFRRSFSESLSVLRPRLSDWPVVG